MSLPPTTPASPPPYPLLRIPLGRTFPQCWFSLGTLGCHQLSRFRRCPPTTINYASQSGGTLCIQTFGTVAHPSRFLLTPWPPPATKLLPCSILVKQTCTESKLAVSTFSTPPLSRSLSDQASPTPPKSSSRSPEISMLSAPVTHTLALCLCLSAASDRFTSHWPLLLRLLPESPHFSLSATLECSRGL